MGQGDSPTVRAEPGRVACHVARVGQANPALLDVPDRQGMALRIPGRQVTAIRTEAEDEELSIASRVESYDFAVVGDEPDLDRPVAKEQGIARHGGVEGNIEDSRGPLNCATGGSQVGQGQAGDGLVT